MSKTRVKRRRLRGAFSGAICCLRSLVLLVLVSLTLQALVRTFLCVCALHVLSCLLLCVCSRASCAGCCASCCAGALVRPALSCPTRPRILLRAKANDCSLAQLALRMLSRLLLCTRSCASCSACALANLTLHARSTCALVVSLALHLCSRAFELSWQVSTRVVVYANTCRHTDCGAELWLCTLFRIVPELRKIAPE